MKPTPNPFTAARGLGLAVFAVFGIVLSAPVADAAVSTWVGDTSADLSGLNWTGTNNPPISADSWVFGTAGTFGATLNNGLTANLSVAGIAFNAGGSAYTIGGNAITLTGNITDNFVGTETLNFNIATTAVRTLTTATGSTLVLGGNVSGTGGGLIAAGAGTLNLTGANTYTGATQVNSAVNITGTGYINSGSSLSAGSAATGVLGYSSSGTSTLGSIVLGTGSGNGTLNQSAGTINATSLTMNNALGRRGIYNLSGGTLAVSGTAVVGQRNDTGTAFNLSDSGILTASSLVVGGIGNNNASTYGTFTQSGGSATAGTLTLAQSSSDTGNVHQGTYNLNGGTLTTGSVSGGSPSATSTHTSTFNFAGGTLKASASSTTFMQGLTTANVKTGGAIIDTNGFDLTIGQALLQFSTNNSTLTKNGTGTLTLTGTNTYTGGTSVTGGTLAITATGSISSTGILGAGNTAAGIFQYDSSESSNVGGINLGNSASGTVNQTAGQINVSADVRLNTGLGRSGTYNLSGGTLAVAGDVNVGQRGAASTFNLSGSGNLTVAEILGVVSNTTLNGTGNTTSGTFTQSGTSAATVGLLLLTNTNNTDQTYTNTATYNLNGGTLTTGSVGVLNIGTLLGGSNNSIFNFAGGTLKASTSSTTFMQGLTTANVKNGGASIDTNGFNLTIGQSLVHFAGATTDGLTKSGNGTLTLSGTNTYAGATLISGGTLALDASGSVDNTSEVSLGTVGTFDVSAKSLGYTVGTLKGSGNVTGALTVSTQLAIGNSPGTTHFSSDLTLDSATYVYEMTGGTSPGLGSADLGIVADALTITAGSILDLVELGTYTAGNKFTLFGYGTLSGTFDGLANNAEFLDDLANTWRITYDDTSAGANGGIGTNFVTITAVPEPNVAALLGGLGALVLLRRRR